MQKWFILFWPMTNRNIICTTVLLQTLPQSHSPSMKRPTCQDWHNIISNNCEKLVLIWQNSGASNRFSEYFFTKLTGEPNHWILLVFVMGSLTESLFMYLFANATLIVIYELKLFHLWLASKPKQNIFNIKWGKFI